MKCALVARFGNTNDTISVVTDWPKPQLSGKGQVLVRVHACSLSPSDYRMSSGDAGLFKKPKSFPYIPGLDVSGVVVDVDPDSDSDPLTISLRAGDEVVGTWTAFGVGGMAQYALVDKKYAARKPPSIPFVDAAGLANSAPRAMLALDALKPLRTDRVLVLGGSGGMGTALVQLLKERGVAFVATTSTNAKLMRDLGADTVIDYTSQAWWELPELTSEPLDAIVDCAEGVSAWRRARSAGVLKGARQGGRFLAVVINEWDITIKSWWGMLAWAAPVIGRLIWTRFAGGSPRYMATAAEPERKDLERLLAMVQDEKLRCVIDPACPLPLTEEGVKRAFSLHVSRHARGKVVVAIE